MAVDQELALVDHPRLREGPRALPALCGAELPRCSPPQTQTLAHPLEQHPRPALTRVPSVGSAKAKNRAVGERGISALGPGLKAQGPQRP